MANEDFNIKHFATKVRQLVAMHSALKEENDGLYVMIDERDNEIKMLKEKLEKMQNDYNMLKLAKMMTLSDADIDATRKRINHYIREVEQCITLLNDKK